MKIYVLEAYVDLYKEIFDNWKKSPVEALDDDIDFNSKEVIEALSPRVRFCIKEYEVIEEHKDYYVRKNDGSYSEIYTHKDFDPKKEYDYEDEVLNYPFITERETRRISANIPTTSEGIEKAKEILLEHVEKIFDLEKLRMKKMIEALSHKSNWQEYKPTYNWEENEDEEDDE